MKKLKELSIYTILFLVSPFVTMCFSLLNLLKGKKSLMKIFFLSLSTSLMSVYYPPLFDSITHFWFYNVLKNLSFKNFMMVDYDKVYTLPFYLLNKINIQYYSVCFIYIFLIIYLWLKCFYDIKTLNKNSKKNENIYFLMFLLAFSYRYPLDLMRFTLATMIFIYSFNNLLKKNKKKYIITALLAGFIHFSLMVVIIISLFNYFFIKNKLKQSKFILILMVVLSFTIIEIGSIVLKLGVLNNRISQKLRGYMIDNNKGFSFIFNSGITGIVTFIGIIIAVLITVYLFKKDNLKNSKSTKIYIIYKNNLILLSWFYWLIFSNWLLNERFLFFYIVMFINYIFLEYQTTQNKIAEKRIIIILFLLTFRTLSLNYRYLNWSLDKSYNMIKDNEQSKTFILKSFVYSGVELLNIKENGYSNSIFLQNTKIKEDFKYLKKIKGE